MDEFTGRGAPVSEDGLTTVLQTLGVPAANLWAVLAVETSGCGFLSDRRPKILFERHIFHRLTQGHFDSADPDVSAPTPGGYGQGGAHQYLRLQAAIALNRDAALKSASWGLGQIMGGNFAQAGYSDVASMVSDFVHSEDAQLAGMASFVAHSGMKAALQSKNWATFARLYNGPNYAANNYDGNLRVHCAHYETAGTPDVVVRACQAYLNYLGFDTGGIDGVVGRLSTTAARDYQRRHGLAETGHLDAPLLASLEAA